MDALMRELAVLQRRYPDAHVDVAGDGQRVLVVPGVRTTGGWSKDEVTVRVVVPIGYPHTQLDCFFADGDLRLANGAEPASSAMQSVGGASHRWFSWHVAHWSPGQDGLDQFIRFCERRLGDAR